MKNLRGASHAKKFAAANWKLWRRQWIWIMSAWVRKKQKQKIIIWPTKPKPDLEESQPMAWQTRKKALNSNNTNGSANLHKNHRNKTAPKFLQTQSFKQQRQFVVFRQNDSKCWLQLWQNTQIRHISIHSYKNAGKDHWTLIKMKPTLQKCEKAKWLLKKLSLQNQTDAWQTDKFKPKWLRIWFSAFEEWDQNMPMLKIKTTTFPQLRILKKVSLKWPKAVSRTKCQLPGRLSHQFVKNEKVWKWKTRNFFKSQAKPQGR